uniref:Uncharacterized protein n=1 Tax=Rhipicephalus microplus TaxID=6941 RepID=A0A6M2DBM1_RHIMP
MSAKNTLPLFLMVVQTTTLTVVVGCCNTANTVLVLYQIDYAQAKAMVCEYLKNLIFFYWCLLFVSIHTAILLYQSNFECVSSHHILVLWQSCLSSFATVTNLLIQENAGSNMQITDVAESRRGGGCLI